MTFTAKTVLDVEVYLEDSPIPDEFTADHLPNAPGSASTSKEMRDFDKLLPLQRGVPPPLCHNAAEAQRHHHAERGGHG